MSALLTILLLILAAAIWLFGPFVVWATIVTIIAVVGCLGTLLVIEGGR